MKYFAVIELRCLASGWIRPAEYPFAYRSQERHLNYNFVGGLTSLELSAWMALEALNHVARGMLQMANVQAVNRWTALWGLA